MRTPFYTDDLPDINLYHGDCIEVMREMEPDSVDSIVTDPPYGLTEPRSLVGFGTTQRNGGKRTAEDKRLRRGGFMGKKWDGTGISFDPATWAECLRVLKPGGHLLAFGGSRTYHRLACAIEDAGFDIRDQIQWLYGSGFPKSLDVGKAIDAAALVEREIVGRKQFADGTFARVTQNLGTGVFNDPQSRETNLHITAPTTDAAKQWDGWGTALKPAHEPIVLARKPIVGTVAENVLKHGTGGLNIAGCRVEGEVPSCTQGQSDNAGTIYGADQRNLREFVPHDLGRWPANVIHDGSEEVLAGFPDSQGQQGDVRGTEPSHTGVNVYGEYGRIATDKRGDSGSAARFFYTAKASKDDREDGLEDMPLLDTRETVNRDPESAGVQSPRAGAGRGAGAPIYRCSACGMNLNSGGRAGSLCPSLSSVSGEHVRELVGYGEGSRNNHPTVKPVALMRYLCRLVTPPKGIVLDPFLGSGSTGKAARLELFRFIGIEKEEAYCQIAARRCTLKMKSLFSLME